MATAQLQLLPLICCGVAPLGVAGFATVLLTSCLAEHRHTNPSIVRSRTDSLQSECVLPMEIFHSLIAALRRNIHVGLY